ncbi:MAG: MFS transporter [Bacteroidetes bacterium]|nr:MAG: MFS transporter [Bacteroidota bacterium]
MLLFGVSLITLGSVATPLREKFMLDEIGIAGMFSILPFGFLVGSLIFGPICDRFGYKLLLAISCILLFFGFEGIAFSTTSTILKASIFLFGTCGGAINGATNALVSDISSSEKGANLSLLGVFFGIGALGMPFFLGLLRNTYSFETILAAVGWFSLFVGIAILLVKFPSSKQVYGFPLSKMGVLIKDPFIILIAFYLFLQSSFEAIINNWTTTYLQDRIRVSQEKALFALTFFVLGMTLMRMLTGIFFRKMAPSKMILVSFVLILISILQLWFSQNYLITIIGLILLGAGLAGGFPIMLGLVGDNYSKISGTAFSLVLVVALTGNMLLNLLMGWVAHEFGIHHLLTVVLFEFVLMVILSVFIFKKNYSNKI